MATIHEPSHGTTTSSPGKRLAKVPQVPRRLGQVHHAPPGREQQRPCHHGEVMVNGYFMVGEWLMHILML